MSKKEILEEKVAKEEVIDLIKGLNTENGEKCILVAKKSSYSTIRSINSNYSSTITLIASCIKGICEELTYEDRKKVVKILTKELKDIKKGKGFE